MNPWLTQQLAEARTNDWLRAADHRRRAAAVGTREPARAGHAALESARSGLGSLLIRTGQRMIGPAAVGDARLA